DYITRENRGRLHLTPKGQALASQRYERYLFFTRLLSQIGVPLEIARKDACSIEHVISNESYEMLKIVHSS
ncbi:MAG: metal-dependent transcriptional regulator, partial [Lachnospiraceae bacterium]|nr:metal-dependent transcriptional regulator [Lachnospiraceae bacterium]